MQNNQRYETPGQALDTRSRQAARNSPPLLVPEADAKGIQKIFLDQKANRWKISQTSARTRIDKLKKIKNAIFKYQKELQNAIYADFRKNPAETDLTEIYPTISEINHTISHLSSWMKPQRVKRPLTLLGTKSEIRYEAKGVVLILSPWNYPFQLLMAPLVAAIAAGNCVILKPSSKTSHTSAFLKKFISDLFDENEIALIEGDADIADQLLTYPFDHIFFTGSPKIGKKVMQAAAQNLTPVTLELGGKSPVVIDRNVDIQTAAERVMWGKFINAGQTCVAPDYVLIHQDITEAFVKACIQVIEKRYGKGTQEESADFCRLVSEGSLKSLKNILDESIKQGAHIAYGGHTSAKTSDRFLSPTILTNVTPESAIMREEIFGPILPLVTFQNLEDALKIIQEREKPLALYVFSKDKHTIQHVIQNTTAGGTCINSLIIHLANPDLPFGGVGYSGMGNYHGFFGFRTFSHERAILKQTALDTLKMFYPPYTPTVRKMINLATKYL